MADYLDEMRRLTVRHWMAEEERPIAWLARKSGYTREYLTNVLNEHHPFTDKLVRTLSERIGIDFGNADVEESKGKTEDAALVIVS